MNIPNRTPRTLIHSSSIHWILASASHRSFRAQWCRRSHWNCLSPDYLRMVGVRDEKKGGKWNEGLPIAFHRELLLRLPLFIQGT